MSTLTERLRRLRVMDTLHIQAADEIDRLERELAAARHSARDLLLRVAREVGPLPETQHGLYIDQMLKPKPEGAIT